MTLQDSTGGLQDPPGHFPRHRLGTAERRLLIVAATLILAALFLMNQVPRWFGW